MNAATFFEILLGVMTVVIVSFAVYVFYRLFTES
ncbi:hypothetical protein NS506_01391 [Nocardia seriolae]|uniref:Potassium-transporting ATPase n=1 Tax=Nocardia seriolae TaxID=37332 RepID=A0ABC8AMM8_9NOCA|nr:hypothetical protein NS506_01391 [Nocardia seriolae]